jgi:hypothetical protein
MDPFARELLDRARDAHDPAPGDQARVRAKLAARIGAVALAAGATRAGAKAAGMGSASWLLKILLPVLLVLAAGGMLLRRDRSEERPIVVPVVAATSPAASAAAMDVAAEAPLAQSAAAIAAPVDSPPAPSASAAPAPVAAPARSNVPTAAASATSSLEAEMALLASAQAAIQRGDYASALAKLDEHQRAFPGGVLGEERTAARVVALCGAGRQAEARALGVSFLARHPGSPLAPRVRSSCASQ